MTTRDFTANVISATKVVPDGNFKDSKASGVWDINEALDLIKGGNWPNVANINPSAFVDALFQCHLYDGTGSEQTITNNIDFTKGGLIITKRRDSSTGNGPYWNDTERGVTNYVRSDSDGGDGAQNSSSTGAVVSTSSTGYAVGTFNGWNNSSGEYVSWTFRKQPKFFDIVTWTGNGTENRTISHNLGSVPGMIIVKAYSFTEDWNVYHRGTGNAKYLQLNSTAAAANVDTGVGGANLWMSTDPTSTTFKIDEHNRVNKNGESYVAYLFAHNDDDGGFGEPGDQDIIKCGSYTGNGNATGPVVTLGFEPQFLMIKRASGGTGDWDIYDNMRGIPDGAGEQRLEWNTSDAESTAGADRINLNSTGFSIATTNSNVNTNGDTYVYMAIRRGGMQTPTAASDVFAINTTGTNDSPNNNFTVGFDPDLSLNTQTNGNQRYLVSRLLGNGTIKANDNTAVNNIADASFFGNPSGTIDLNTNFWGTASNLISWSWKRARGYFDVVTYNGTGSARTVSHNLGVVPEMMWVKRRDTTGSWMVYHKGLNGGTNPEQYVIYLEATEAENQGGSGVWNNTAPTSSVFSVNNNNGVNNSSGNYIAYLFATVAGVSKVGSFSHTSGQTQNIDCGFSSGARFVLVKQRGSTGAWFVYDTTRGIVAGNDPRIKLDDTSAQNTSNDDIDPLSSGFTLTTNFSGGDYIFYAIA